MQVKKAVSFVLLCLLSLMLAACSAGEDPGVLRQEALALREAGSYEQAAELFGRALKASGGRSGEPQVDLLRYKADCEFMAGRLEDAAVSYDALLQLGEDSRRQQFYQERRDYIDRYKLLQQASSIMEEGNYPEALDVLEPLTKGNDDIAKTALFNQAVCCEYTHEFEKALRYFEEYDQRYPGDPAAEKEITFLRSRRPQE